MTNSDNSYHYETDARWHWVLSANEWVLAYDEDTPVLSGRRAAELIAEKWNTVDVPRCNWQGFGRLRLSSAQLSECGCTRCAEWLARERVQPKSTIPSRLVSDPRAPGLETKADEIALAATAL